MEEDDLHECTEYDQLNTCVECGAPKNPMPDTRKSGGAGASRHALSDEEYKSQIRKIQRRSE